MDGDSSSTTAQSRSRRAVAGGAVLLFAAAYLITDYASARGSVPSAPSPLPHERIHSRRDWRTPDGRHFALCILGLNREERGRALAIYDSSGAGWRQVFLDDDRGFHPWALEIGELDGDALPEVVVGTYKTSRFDPVQRNRIFIFDWTDENRLFAKWLGSRLGATLERFALARGPDGRDRLFVRASDPRGDVRRYRWIGFGFALEAEVSLPDAPSSLSDEPTRRFTPPAGVAGR